MSEELHCIASTRTADPLLLNPRPSVICLNSESRRDVGLPTRVFDVNSNFIHSSPSAFTPYHLTANRPQSLPGRSRSSSIDDQHLQQRPVVLSGRPSYLTSYLLDSRDPAQQFQEMNQIPVFFPGYQKSVTPQCSRAWSNLEDDFLGYCCREDRRQNNEVNEIFTGSTKRATMPLSYPEQPIEKPRLSGQRFSVCPNYHGQLPEGGAFEHCEALDSSPKYETRTSYDLEEQEEAEQEDDDMGRKAQEEQKKFSYEVEPRNAPENRDETPVRHEEHSGNESALMLIDNRGNKIKINGASQRNENEKQTSSSHGLAHCRNLCCRPSTSSLYPLGHMHRNTRDMKKRAEHMSRNRTQNHGGGTTCLVCFKTLKRSHYMKNHMLVHTGEKPYKCAYCEKSFNQIGNKNAHQRIHTGEKPYACEYCGKRFIFNSTKHNHMKVHSQSSSVHPPKEEFSTDE